MGLSQRAKGGSRIWGESFSYLPVPLYLLKESCYCKSDFEELAGGGC